MLTMQEHGAKLQLDNMLTKGEPVSHGSHETPPSNPNSLHLAQQAYATLVSLATKVERFADQHHSSLTGKQYLAMLAVLHLDPEETSITNIAHKLGTSKQNTQRMLATIQSKGYITIAPVASDRRAVNVHLTTSGSEVMAQNAGIGTRFLTELFGDFTDDETATMWSLLQKLHRFDGVEYQGYEADASTAFAERHPDAAERARAEQARPEAQH